MARELRPYQVAALDGLREKLKEGCRRPVLQLPTGGGKTAIACHIIQRYVERGKRVIFTVPAIDLIEQTYKDFFHNGIYDIGVIQANHPMTNRNRMVQIASLQTLSRRTVEPPTVVIVDEAHRRDKNISKLMRDEAWADVIWIGLSATPWSKGLGQDYDALVIANTTKGLIEAGYLSTFVAYGPPTHRPDYSGVSTTAGDYNEAESAKVMNTPQLVGQIVEHWIEIGPGEKTLVFGVDCAHAMSIQSEFERVGIPCGYQDAQTPREERVEIARKFASGEFKVVSNVGTLTTGVDWDVRCIILARKTKSEILYTQIVGRGLRMAGGKDKLILLDHSTTTNDLGFVTDIFHGELDDGERKPKEAREREEQDRAEAVPKECPSCHFMRPPRVHTCPNCGFAPKPKSTVEYADGRLVQLNGRKNVAISEQNFYAQLLCYGNAKGYKPGWAWHKYAGKIGHPPDPALRRVPPAAEVSREVASWIKADLIRWIKAKERDAA